MLALGVAATAGAQGQPAGGRCADPCQACMASIQGTGASRDAASCPNACAACDRAKAAERRAEAARSSAQPQAGGDVRASLDQIGQGVSSAAQGAVTDVRQNLGQASDRGIQGVGLRRNTLVTDAIGSFTGEGLNAEYQRPLAEKISGVAGAHYSRANTVGGSATTFGAVVGADYFLLGGYNQGLRLGPRLGLDVGGLSANNDTSLQARLGLGGELGYNWMGRSGVSLQLAGGVGGRVGGSVGGLDDRLGGDFGPYLEANLGWSW